MSEFKGYIKVSGKEAIDCALKAKKFITKVQEGRKEKFLKWAYPYFRKRWERKHWWQFWRAHSKYFKTPADFFLLFKYRYRHHLDVYQDDMIEYAKSVDGMIREYDEPSNYDWMKPDVFWGFDVYLDYKEDVRKYASHLLIRAQDQDELLLEAEQYGRLRWLCEMEF